MLRGQLADNEVVFSLKNKRDANPVTILSLSYPILKFKLNTKMFHQNSQNETNGTTKIYLNNNKLNRFQYKRY